MADGHVRHRGRRQRDGIEVKFLRNALDVMTADLGCMAMRDAAERLSPRAPIGRGAITTTTTSSSSSSSTRAGIPPFIYCTICTRP